jgi:O-Antigen ligase
VSAPQHPIASAAGPTGRTRVPVPSAIGLCLAAAGPAAITAYLAVRSGGYFAGAPAIVAIVLAIALVLRLMLAEAPFEGFGPAMIWAIAGMGCFTLWTLLSTFWSHAPAQALIAFDRALMLWLALILFGSFGLSRHRLLWALRALAATITAIAILGLITRLLPHIHSIPEGFQRDRLSYPLSYWNGLGIFVSVGILLCCGLTTRAQEQPIGKALAAAAVPILATTLYFTFSRGSIGVLVIGTIVFVALAARRELIPAALAIVPPTMVIALLCIGTHTLSTEHYAASAGVSEGHRLTWELIACAVGAGVLRLASLPLDRRLQRIEISPEFRRRAWIVVGVAVAIVVVAVGVGAHGKISSGFESFAESKGVKDTGELQTRLTDVNNNGRIAQWRLGLDRFADEPLLGDGAGTFARSWAKEGEAGLRIIDSHSLYLGVMAELGLPGLIFLLVCLLAILIATARRISGPERVLYAGLFAAILTWAIHAGVDWDWQMPATGFFVFAAGGMAIAAPAASRSTRVPRALGRTTRIALSLCALALVVSPALVAISQGYLNSAVDDFKKDDCAAASRNALDAIHALSVRPDPYQVLGFCDAYSGQDRLATAVLETAVSRDKGEWESWYGLAVVRAAAGEDPRLAARKAYELAPHEPLAVEGIRLFGKGNPQKWERRAERARLPIN